MDEIIYLDNNATTRCAPEVVEAMHHYHVDGYGNPSSVHAMGRSAANAVYVARKSVARAIGCTPEEIVFTSGATESNNLALLGLSGHSDRKKIVTTSIEHKSVLEPCQWLAQSGFEVVRLPVISDGIVDLSAAEKTIDDSTLFVSVQGANNEVGTVQPVRTIAKLAHLNGSYVHCDATQLLGKLEFSVRDLQVDFASFSSHKVYGPKGVGALYISRHVNRNHLRPTAFGGGQESQLRPGTVNVPGVVGFGKACKLIMNSLPSEAVKIIELRDRFEEHLLCNLETAVVNCKSSNRLPGTSSVTIPGVNADMLIANVPRICISSGSACSSGTPEPSHVLLALGMDREIADCAIRACFGRYNTCREVEAAAEAISAAAKRLQSMLA